LEKAESIKNNLKVLTWRKLEAKGKFDKNAKLIFISDDMLILGCDTGSETHYLRVLDIGTRNNRCKYYFVCKIVVLNIKKFCKYLQGLGNCTLNVEPA